MVYLIFYIGAILGSFYLVLGTRLPIKEDVILSRSHCDSCKRTLKWYQLIPIFSYVIFLGKCKYCKKRIPLINLIVEIATGLIFSLLYLKFGFCYEYYASLIISSLLIIIFISDFKYFIILDSPLVISGIAIFTLKWVYFGYVAAFKALLSGIILFIVMYFVGLFGKKIFKKEALGGGDIKFAAIIGLTLGLRLGLLSLMLASFLALPVSIVSISQTKNNEVPFGPFLVGALFVIFLFMDKFTNLINLLFSL